jgi:hypothetical protein
MVQTFSEELLTIDELRSRMPDLRARETGLRKQLEALDAQIVGRDAYLKRADNLETFLAQLHNKTITASIDERTHVLRLLRQRRHHRPTEDHHPAPHPHPRTRHNRQTTLGDSRYGGRPSHRLPTSLGA